MKRSRTENTISKSYKNNTHWGERCNGKELPLMVDVSTRYIIYVKGDKKLQLKLVAFTVTAATN